MVLAIRDRGGRSQISNFIEIGKKFYGLSADVNEIVQLSVFLPQTAVKQGSWGEFCCFLSFLSVFRGFKVTKHRYWSFNQFFGCQIQLNSINRCKKDDAIGGYRLVLRIKIKSFCECNMSCVHQQVMPEQKKYLSALNLLYSLFSAVTQVRNAF